MPATCSSRGVLKASTNRVRTSTALQGNSMWENVIGITNEQAGTNTGVEALINAPTIGGGRKATQARRQAAAEAVLATGGFDTSITNYQSLLAIAKQQGAVGSGAATRGACKVCGQMGHLTKQCRNGLASGGGEEAVEGSGVGELAVPIAASEDDAGDSLDLSSDSSDDERARKKARKEKKEKKRKHKSSSKDKKHKSSKKSKKERKEKRSSKDKKHKRSKKRRHSSSSGSSSSSSSDSD